MKLFKSFHKQKTNIGFYDWLKLNGKLDDVEYNQSTHICSRFELSDVHYEIHITKDADTKIMKDLLMGQLLSPVTTIHLDRLLLAIHLLSVQPRLDHQI